MASAAEIKFRPSTHFQPGTADSLMNADLVIETSAPDLEVESLYTTALERGSCAKGFLWAIGLEIASAVCLYGLWQALHKFL